MSFKKNGKSTSLGIVKISTEVDKPAEDATVKPAEPKPEPTIKLQPREE